MQRILHLGGERVAASEGSTSGGSGSRWSMQLIERLWSPCEVSVTIPASRPDVYDTIADPTTYPEWLGGAQNVRAVDPAFPKAGAGFDHEVGPTKDLTVADDSVSEGAQRPERLDLEVHIHAFTGHVEFHLADAGDGTEVTLREHADGAWAIAMPLLRAALFARNRGSLERLRDRFSQ
jgi:uncharacterized protein YndB with AHSA1/START domain